MYIVALNGPPFSGKDTFGQFLLERIEEMVAPPPVKLESLNLPLRSIAYAMVGSHYTEDTDTYDEFKATTYQIGDRQRTGRQLMIDVAEEFLKKLYGQETLATLFIERNSKAPRNSILIIRDCGFQIEVNPLIRWVGRENVMVVRINRPACSFNNDSREWVYHPDPRANYVVQNLFGLNELRQRADQLFESMVGHMGWKF